MLGCFDQSSTQHRFSSRYCAYLVIALLALSLLAFDLLYSRKIFDVKIQSASLGSWISKQENEYGDDVIRLGCREFPKRGQTCAYGGTTCVDMNDRKPFVYFLSSTQKDFSEVSSDLWCEHREKSAHLFYWGGPREWPPPASFAPRQSCLRAKWRSFESLFGGKQNKTQSKIRWVPDLAYFKPDYRDDNHNNHYLMDMVWHLDLVIWNYKLNASVVGFPNHFKPPNHIFLPQTRQEFDRQTSRDVNRLLFSIIFGMDLNQLYVEQKRTEIEGLDGKLETRPLFKAYPYLNESIEFYEANTESEPEKNVTLATDLLCTKRLLVGAKLGDLGHDRVCTHIREESWDFYNITTPPNSYAATGYLHIDRAPRRVVLLNRHITRGFRNLDQVVAKLEKLSKQYSFEFEVASTRDFITAEDHVKFFSRIGVLLSTHGSQDMGVIWMPRYSALIEAFPPIYIDYSFRTLANTCNVQFFELYGKIPNELKDKYAEYCEEVKITQHYGQCSAMKNEPVLVDVEETGNMVLLALRKIGHEFSPPRLFVNNRTKGQNK